MHGDNENIYNDAKTIGRNIFWLSITQIINQVWEFSVSIVLARILVPEDFGIYAIAMVFYGICQVFSTFGISQVIIQKKEITPLFIKTAQSICFLWGLFLCCILLAFSVIIAGFYKQPVLIGILCVLSLLFVINSLYIISDALLMKNQRFRTILFIQVSASLCYGIFSIIPAYLGAGVWSLVFGIFALSTFLAITININAKNLPLIGWGKQEAREIFGFGSTLTISSLLNYLSRNLDYLIIGKVLGINPLGIYKRAYDLATLPKDKVMEVVARGFLPALTDIRDNKENVKKLILFYIKIISYVVCPVLIGLCVVAKDFISLVYGEKWIQAVFPLRIFCIGGIFYATLALFNIIFTTYKEQKIIIIMQSIYTSTLTLLVITGTLYGLRGVSLGTTVAIIIYSLTALYYARKVINVYFSDFYHTIKKPLLLSIAMGLTISALGNAWLILKVICGVFIYVLLLSIFKDPDIIAVIKRLIDKSGLYRLKKLDFYGGIKWRYRKYVSSYLNLYGSPGLYIHHKMHNHKYFNNSRLIYICSDRSNIGDYISSFGIKKLMIEKGIELFCADEGQAELKRMFLKARRSGKNYFAIVGGGGLLQNVFDPFWEILIESEIPFATFGIGINKMNGRSITNKSLMEKITQHALFLGVRDKMTKDELAKSSRININIGICPSANFLYPFYWQPNTIGNNILLHSAHYDDIRLQGADIRKISDNLKKIAKKLGLIYKEVNNINSNYKSVLKDFYQARVVVSSRLHGCIISYCMGIPFISVCCDDKIDAFLRTHVPQDETVCIDELYDLEKTMYFVQQKLHTNFSNEESIKLKTAANEIFIQELKEVISKTL